MMAYVQPTSALGTAGELLKGCIPVCVRTAEESLEMGRAEDL